MSSFKTCTPCQTEENYEMGVAWGEEEYLQGSGRKSRMKKSPVGRPDVSGRIMLTWILDN
jgi:hypothetical protein